MRVQSSGGIRRTGGRWYWYTSSSTCTQHRAARYRRFAVLSMTLHIAHSPGIRCMYSTEHSAQRNVFHRTQYATATQCIPRKNTVCNAMYSTEQQSVQRKVVHRTQCANPRPGGGGLFLAPPSRLFNISPEPLRLSSPNLRYPPGHQFYTL